MRTAGLLAWLALAEFAALVACAPPTTGAACRDNGSCPSGQYCTAACACAALGSTDAPATECTSLGLKATFGQGTFGEAQGKGRFGAQVLLSADGTRAVVAMPESIGLTDYGGLEAFFAKDAAGTGWGRLGAVYGKTQGFGRQVAGNDTLSVVTGRSAYDGAIVTYDWDAQKKAYERLAESGGPSLTAVARSGTSPLSAWQLYGTVHLWQVGNAKQAGAHGWDCPEEGVGRGMGVGPSSDVLVLSCQGLGQVYALSSVCSPGVPDCVVTFGASAAFDGRFVGFLGDADALVADLGGGEVQVSSLRPRPSAGTSQRLPVLRTLRFPKDTEDLVFDGALHRVVLRRAFAGEASRVEVWDDVQGTFVKQGRLFPPDATAAKTFGTSLAISADGKRVLVGAPEANRAWLFGE